MCIYLYTVLYTSRLSIYISASVSTRISSLKYSPIVVVFDHPFQVYDSGATDDQAGDSYFVTATALVALHPMRCFVRGMEREIGGEVDRAICIIFFCRPTGRSFQDEVIAWVLTRGILLLDHPKLDVEEAADQFGIQVTKNPCCLEV